MVRKVDAYLFMSNTVICVVYVDDCLFWSCSQSEIDKAIKSFKGGGTSYNWEHSKGDSMSELLVIDTKTLYDGGFQFYHNVLILKLLEATRMEHCNGFPTPTKVEAPLGTD